MTKVAHCLTLCLLYAGAATADQTVRLQFALQDPVQLIQTNTLEISQSVPGLKLNCTSQQNVKAVLSIEAPHHGTTVSQPPFDALLRIQGFRVHISANQENATFDSGDPGTSFLMAAISKIIDRPIRIHIDKKMAFSKDSEDLLKVLNDIPALKEIDPRALLEGILQPIFALAGKNLHAGAKFQQKIMLGIEGAFPATINYVIAGINDNTVLAEISGELEPQTVNFKRAMEVDGKNSENAALTLTGTMKGEVSWDRQNSLLFNLKSHYQFNGIMKIGDFDWPLTAELKTNFSTAKN